MSQHDVSVTTGSNSTTPDLDWSQVRETVKMLNLAIAQVSGSLVHGDESVSALTESFTSMAQAIMEIHETIDGTEGSENDPVLSTIDQKCKMLSNKVHSAIIAFQFYDRFSQNLSHVNESLGSLSDLVNNQEKLYNPLEWSSLQKEIRDRYTMPEERDLFDQILNGASVTEVLAVMKEKNEEHEEQDSGEIELF